MRRRPLRSNGRPFAVRNQAGGVASSFFPAHMRSRNTNCLIVMPWSMTTAVEVSCCTSQGSGLSAG